MKLPEKSPFGNSIIKNLLVIVGAGALIIFLLFLFAHVYTRHNQNIEVPALSTLQVDEAKSILKSKGLKLEVVDSIYRKGAVPGSVIDQNPEPKSNVKRGRSIYVTIYSRMPQQIAIPGLTDFSLRQAQALLVSMGFTQLTIEETPSEYAGLVLSVIYRGKTLRPDEKVPAGSPLTLIVGSGEIIDSLDMNREVQVPPSQVNRNDSRQIIIQTQPAKKEEVKKSKVDDSFFQ